MKPYITVTALKSEVTVQVFVDWIQGIAEPDPKFGDSGAILLTPGHSITVRESRVEVWDKIIDATVSAQQGVQ